MLHYWRQKSQQQQKAGRGLHRRKGCLHGGTSRPSGCTVYTAVFHNLEKLTGGHKTRLGARYPVPPPLDDGPGYRRIKTALAKTCNR